MEFFLLVAGLTFAVYVIRYVITLVLRRGTDAIGNAIVDYKNKTRPSEPKSLADQFKDAE